MSYLLFSPKDRFEKISNKLFLIVSYEVLGEVISTMFDQKIKEVWEWLFKLCNEEMMRRDLLGNKFLRNCKHFIISADICR